MIVDQDIVFKSKTHKLMSETTAGTDLNLPPKYTGLAELKQI